VYNDAKKKVLVEKKAFFNILNSSSLSLLKIEFVHHPREYAGSIFALHLKPIQSIKFPFHFMCASELFQFFEIFEKIIFIIIIFSCEAQLNTCTCA